MEVRKAILPLYVISKMFCICPFSLKSLQPSTFGSIITICQTIGYAVFHLWLVNRDMSEETEKNVVRMLIDSYNRYSGFCAFCFLVITSTANQRKMVSVIRNIEEIDEIFAESFEKIDNRRWRRHVSLQICFCISAISVFEWSNCLMYIQDSVPFSEYCLIMCLVPMFVIGLVETQFFAYLQLIRYRLCLLNKLLIKMANSEKSEIVGRNTMLDKVIQIKSNSIEYLANQANRINAFKNPQVNCTRQCNANAKKITTIEEPNAFRLNDDAYNITQIQRIFSMLERTTIALKSAFSPHLVVILCMKFTTLTSLLYFCCMVIIKIISGVGLNSENEEQLWSSWGWVFALFLEIFILCYASSITKNESQKIGGNLHKFAASLDNNNCKLKVKVFSVQLLFNRIEINPFGLFHLDLNFMYGLIGAVCTYLIILIQFDLAQKAQQSMAATEAPKQSLHHNFTQPMPAGLNKDIK